MRKQCVPGALSPPPPLRLGTRLIFQMMLSISDGQLNLHHCQQGDHTLLQQPEGGRGKWEGGAKEGEREEEGRGEARSEGEEVRTGGARK